MTLPQISHHSKRLSWLLRHGANETALPMDHAGWTPIDSVLKVLGIHFDLLLQIVEENNKQRMELKDGFIRASQGHTLSGTPVTLEALENSWLEVYPREAIWHGTFLEALESIAKQGLIAAGRTHVHLAGTEDSSVGKRNSVQVLLGISPEKLKDHSIRVFQSSNGVILVRHVPPSCITQINCTTNKAKKRENQIRQLFGLPPILPPNKTGRA